MARIALDKEAKRAIRDARAMIQAAEKADCNEAETRRRIERLLESLMGYDTFKHLSRERAVRGAGETEHVDFAIQLGEGDSAKPEIMMEIKRVCIDLAQKHLNQVSSYAINAGCEWIILTNAKEWRLYHVAFGQPPVTKLIHKWNIITDDISLLAKQFDLIAYKNVKRGGLDELWQKTNVLHPSNLLRAILSDSSLNSIKRELKKDSGVSLAPEDILAGVRRLLNETSLAELSNVRISLDKPKLSTRQRKAKTIESFTFKGVKYEVQLWKEALMKLCELVHGEVGSDFDKVVSLKGRNRSYFAYNEAELKEARKINNANIYVETNLSADAIIKRCRDVLSLFGYSDKDFGVETNENLPPKKSSALQGDQHHEKLRDEG